jgi:hypothetical protein
MAVLAYRHKYCSTLKGPKQRLLAADMAAAAAAAAIAAAVAAGSVTADLCH